MPFVRRFYYMPRVSDPNNGTDIPSPVDNLWKPGGSSDIKYDFHPGTMRQQSFQDLPVEVQLKQLYHKKILGILNKVTPKKFEQLISEVGYECRDLTFIKMMAEMIFVKTLEDEIYVLMYAKFCNGIMDNLHTDCRACLRDTLYNLCETGCQHLLTFRDEDISSIDEDIRFVFKRKLMTLVRFIGEMSFINNPLFNHEYSLNLTEKLFDAGDELHLEAIYFLLCTCAFRDNGIKWPDSLWVTVAELAKGVNPSGAFVSARIRFMFLSLAEARIGLVLLDPYSPHNSPSASDSENNDMIFKTSRLCCDKTVSKVNRGPSRTARGVKPISRIIRMNRAFGNPHLPVVEIEYEYSKVDLSKWQGKEAKRELLELKRLTTAVKKISLEDVALQRGPAPTSIHSSREEEKLPLKMVETTKRHSSDAPRRLKRKKERKKTQEAQRFNNSVWEKQFFRDLTTSDITKLRMVEIISKDCARPMEAGDLIVISELIYRLCNSSKIQTENVRISSIYLLNDSVRVVCCTNETVDMIKRSLTGIGRGYITLEPSDRPPYEKIFVWEPEYKDSQCVIKFIVYGNDEFYSESFHIGKVISSNRAMIFDVEPAGVSWLKTIGYIPFCTSNTIYFFQPVPSFAGEDTLDNDATNETTKDEMGHLFDILRKKVNEEERFNTLRNKANDGKRFNTLRKKANKREISISLISKKQFFQNLSRSEDMELRTVEVIDKDRARPMNAADLIFIIERINKVWKSEIKTENVMISSIYLLNGTVCVACCSNDTVDWIKRVFTGIEEQGYTALGPSDRPPYEKFFVWEPEYKDSQCVIKFIVYGSDEFYSKSFHIGKVISNNRTMIFDVEPAGVSWLKMIEYIPFCSSNTIYFFQPVPSFSGEDTLDNDAASETTKDAMRHLFDTLRNKAIEEEISNSLRKKANEGERSICLILKKQFFRDLSRSEDMELRTVEIIDKDCARPMNGSDLIFITGRINKVWKSSEVKTENVLISSIYLLNGTVFVACCSNDTVDWIKRAITGIGERGYTALGPSDRPPYEKFFAWKPGYKDSRHVIEFLVYDNHQFESESFYIQKVISNNREFIFSVEDAGVEWLKTMEYLSISDSNTLYFYQPVSSFVSEDTSDVDTANEVWKNENGDLVGEELTVEDVLANKNPERTKVNKIPALVLEAQNKIAEDKSSLETPQVRMNAESFPYNSPISFTQEEWYHFSISLMASRL